MSESSNNQSADGPLFVIGRQHSGNTMLATVLGRHPEVYAFTGEESFFEHWNSMPHDQHIVHRVVREIEGGSDMEDVPGVEELLSRNFPHPLAQFLREKVGPGASPLGLYLRGKQRVAASNGADRWAQKATSYAFYIEDILQAIPSSRLIFLLRNPLDLTASLKRRGGWSHVLRMVWGWNRGTGHVQK
jgi:hypothetical protein